MVSVDLVEEFRVIIKEEYQVDLEPEDASEIANTLVNFFNLLTKIEFGTEEQSGYNKSPSHARSEAFTKPVKGFVWRSLTV